MVNATKLPVETGAGAAKMADAMFGPGIRIVGAKYTGDPVSAGIFTKGDSIAPDATPSDTGVILSTGKASDFTNTKGEANQTASRTTDTKGVDGDKDLDAIAGGKTFDGAIFEADFIPVGSTLTMQITFSSAEYLEYVGSGLNDAVGIWVNGQKAQLMVGDGDISIDNISPKTNGDLYVDNAKDQYNTEMDGFTVTVTLTPKAPVKPGQVNHIKISIAEGGDTAYDSNLLIAGDSVQTAVIAQQDEFAVSRGGAAIIDLVGNDLESSGGTLTITKINGVPVKAGDHILLPSGLEIVVNKDGTITAIADWGDEIGSASFS